MTPLAGAFLLLCCAAAAAGVALARRNRQHRPVAAYLAVMLGVDLMRWARVLALPPTDAPRQGFELLLRHLEAGGYIAAIVALPALAVAVFLRRPPWAIAAAGAALWLVVVLSYPALRGAELMEVYSLLELAGVLLATGCFLTWVAAPGPAAGDVPVMCAAALTGGAVVVAALSPLASWPTIVAINGLAVAVVLVAQLRPLLRGAPCPS